MATVGAGGGRVDSEEPLIPHGGMLLSGANLSVNGATNLPGISGFVEIGGYRSLVVQVKNLGATDLVFTPRWNFYAGPVPIDAEEGQSVPAGTSKRLLFQNQGDIVNRIRVTGGGAGDTIHYYVTGSNLDPFSGGVRDILTMIQRAPAQSIPNNVGTLIEFGPTPGTTFYTNAAQDWSFDLTGAGNITAVHALVPGLYLCHAHLTLAAPGNYNKELNLLVNSLEPNPPLTQTTTDHSFDTFGEHLECNYTLAISASSTGTANNAIRASCLQVSGAAVNVDAALLQVVRLGPLFP